jgi:tRNA pseudouridine38-40 synthase
MPNIKMTIEYDGTNYCGWQTQKNAISVCDVIKDTIKELTGEEVKLIGCSRTDSGVHAYGQVANFKTESKIPPEKFAASLNAILPDDIAILESKEASPKFHSQFSAQSKHYKYVVYNSKVRSPILRDRAYFMSWGLKITKMKEAAEFFVGEHDFHAFCSAASTAKSHVRTIYDVSVNKKGNIIEIDVHGNGFLYNMVRIIAGTIVDVGRGKIAVEDIKGIIEAGDRKKAGLTAPPQGLYLMKIVY